MPGFTPAGAEPGAVDNLEGWFTTILARVCLDRVTPSLIYLNMQLLAAEQIFRQLRHGSLRPP
jgi:hypothetical protein